MSLPPGSAPSPPTLSFPLLSLPDDLFPLILHHVALQRYAFSESRRPRPSPLFTLSHSHSRLERYATPLLHRRALLNLESGKRPSERWVRFLQVGMSAHLSRGAVDRLERMAVLERCESLEMNWSTYALNWGQSDYHPPTISSILRLCPNVLALHLRRPEGSPPLAQLASLRHLRDISAHLPEPAWLPGLTLLPHVVKASFSLREHTPGMETWAVPAFWGRVEDVELECPPLFRRGSAHPLVELLQPLKIPPTSTLRRLKVAVRLQLQVQPIRYDLELLLPSLRPFAHLPLRRLEIDEYTLAGPESIAALAGMFPLLESLSFGSRTVWTASGEEHFEALGRFGGLRELACPRWAESSENWREPEELVADLAVRLPQLELVGLGGQQSVDQWFRISLGRGQDGRAKRVEAVTLFNTDLDQDR